MGRLWDVTVSPLPSSGKGSACAGSFFSLRRDWQLPRWTSLGEVPSHLRDKPAGLLPRSRLVQRIHMGAEVRRHRKFPRCVLTLHLRGDPVMEPATRPPDNARHQLPPFTLIYAVRKGPISHGHTVPW